MQLSSSTSLAKAITIPALQHFETHLDPNYRSMEVHLTRLSTSLTAPLMVEGVIFDYSSPLGSLAAPLPALFKCYEDYPGNPVTSDRSIDISGVVAVDRGAPVFQMQKRYVFVRVCDLSLNVCVKGSTVGTYSEKELEDNDPPKGIGMLGHL